MMKKSKNIINLILSSVFVFVALMSIIIILSKHTNKGVVSFVLMSIMFVVLTFYGCYDFISKCNHKKTSIAFLVFFQSIIILISYILIVLGFIGFPGKGMALWGFVLSIVAVVLCTYYPSVDKIIYKRIKGALTERQ